MALADYINEKPTIYKDGLIIRPMKNVVIRKKGISDRGKSYFAALVFVLY